MKNKKLFVLMFCIIIIFSSISVTAIPTKRIENKIIPDITNYTSKWIDYNPETKENNDIQNLYYNDPTQVTTQVFESVDLTSLIIQITESTVTNYISTLSGFGPRRTGTSPCDDAGNWIAGVFNSMGLDVRIQEWSAGGYSGNNIEATITGTDESSDEVYLIVGHYDTVSNSPGADDNAAGTAAVLASAEVMSQYTFTHTVKFLAVSGEEQGLYGSTIYADEAAAQGINIKEVLDGDMIAYAETYEDQHTVGIYGSGTLAAMSQQISDTYPGLIDITVQQYGASGNSDHWPFIQNGYDAAMYSEYNFNPYYHSSQDTIDKLDLDYDMRVTRMMMATLAEFSNVIIPDNGGGDVNLITPRVSIEDPINGEYISGSIDIKGKATSIQDSIKQVLVKIDDNDWEKAEIEETPGNYINWTYSWDTTKVDDTFHTISAVSLNNHYIPSPVDSLIVNVLNKRLTTNIIMQNQANVNEIISFQSLTFGGLPPYNYIWDLGDGTKKYEQNISYSYNSPGSYKVEFTVKDSLNNTAYASKTIQIIDDISPTISITQPENAVYLNNFEWFEYKNPIIIGNIDIILEVEDNIGIDHVTIYINNQEKIKLTETPYKWTWDEKIFGTATIKVIVFDLSGNKAEDTLQVKKFF